MLKVIHFKRIWVFKIFIYFTEREEKTNDNLQCEKSEKESMLDWNAVMKDVTDGEPENPIIKDHIKRLKESDV